MHDGFLIPAPHQAKEAHHRGGLDEKRMDDLRAAVAEIQHDPEAAARLKAQKE